MVIADAIGPSWDLVADYQIISQYHFMHNAFLAATLVACIAGVVGYFMVIRSQSFAGHSLANVGFAGATGAALVGASPIVGLFLAGALAALGIQVLGLGARQTRQNDIAVGAIFTLALALGYLFLHLSKNEYGNGIYDVLFGNPLGISDGDVRVNLWAAVFLALIAVGGARPLLFASLDPEVAAARGVPVRALGLGYLIVLALVVALAVQVIGVLLIFALLVTPAAIANVLTTRPVVAIALAVGLGVLFTWLGLVVGFFAPYPVGFFITSFAFAAYIVVRGGRWLLPHWHNVLAAQRMHEVR
ncbi:MAG: metal ABC transporter permease [Ktedonobacterales bacterium]|nr:metal ABC transporter permease [Ktedonobacterales bacterium]